MGPAATAHAAQSQASFQGTSCSLPVAPVGSVPWGSVTLRLIDDRPTSLSGGATPFGPGAFPSVHPHSRVPHTLSPELSP